MRKAPKMPKPTPLPALARYANYEVETGATPTSPSGQRPNKLTPVVGTVSSVKPFLTGQTS